MKVLRVEPAESRSPEAAAAVAEAAQLLRAGGLVAFPTETVYGLGANALDVDAVRRIFAAKGRPGYNPLIAHVPDVEGARRLVARWPETAERLADAFWPGPLTLVLPRRSLVPDVVTAGLDTVAVRVPAHPVALALLRAAGVPLAAPSANRYTQLSPTTAEHVRRALGERIDLILDGGPTRVGIESTVVDLAGDEPRLLRPGQLGRARLEAVLGRPLGSLHLQGSTPRPSPGMTERHYSPRARLVLLDRADTDALTRAASEARERGETLGALLLDGGPAEAGALPEGLEHAVRMSGEPDAYARELYGALHRLDELGCDRVLVQTPPATGPWEAIRDRLARAAH